LGVARRRGSQQVAHEAAADGGEEQFAAHRSGIRTAFGHRPIHQHSMLPDGRFRSKRRNLVDCYFDLRQSS
jgi:hypothetical protein